MEVRDVDEFMEDIDEYQVKDVERWEDEHGNLKHLTVVMESVIAEDTAELWVEALYKRDSNYDMYPSNPKAPAIEYGRKEWCELTYYPDKQDAEHDAVIQLYKLLFEDKVDFDEVLDIPYELEILRGK